MSNSHKLFTRRCRSTIMRNQSNNTHENTQKISHTSSASSDTMNNQNSKTSLRIPRIEMSDIITKHQDISKSGTTTIRGKTDAVTNSKIPSGSFLHSNSPAKICKKTNNRSKPMGAVSKISTKETNGGVHEFIMNVSNYIEKNNYLKESGTQQQSRGQRRRNDLNSINSIQFNNGLNRKIQEKNQNDSKKLVQVQKPWEKNCFSESPRRNLQYSKPEEKHLNENNFEHPQKLRYSNLDLTRDIHEYLENEQRRKTSPVRMKPTTPLCDNDLIRKRPSEIPLRKSRKSPRRPSTSSLPKSFREAEGGGSFFPNFDDFDLQSEFQMTFNFNFNTDDISNLGTKDTDRILNALANEICSLPEDTLFLEKFLSDKPYAKNGKIIPENNERTSSFTVLSKLESLHKQTLAERKRISKTTVNPRKVEKTKKKLDLQSSTKENKAGPKTKTKKVKETEKESQDKLTKDAKRKVVESSKPKTELKKPDPWVSVFTKAEPSKKEENKYPKKSVLNKQKSVEFEGSLKEKDLIKAPLKFLRQELEKSEKPKTARSSSENPRSKNYLKSCNSEEKNICLKSGKNPSIICPSTPNSMLVNATKYEETDDKEWSLKSLLCVDKLASGNSSRAQLSRSKSPEKKIETSQETSELEIDDLIVKGKPLKSAKDEPPEKQEESDQPAGKKHLKIDLRTPEDIIEAEMAEETPEYKSTFDWFLMDEGICLEENTGEKSDWEKCISGETFSGRTANQGLLSVGYSASCKTSKDDSSAGHKAVRKEKIRSDAGDRPFSESLFDSDLTRHNKIKLDSKLRSGLRKSFREDARDTLEDAALLKLKRRGSEPNSFRGFILKCVDRPIPKDHKASVSSMTSSLRHLNTDEIDDFILWEAIPQKMTCWWEMSLYNCKRTWSVLSNRVFKDNRKSSTPGLILENLRNGITPNTRDTTRIQKDRAACRKENPFDVEPSIAQKNIDIRNWLAALNFPTPPSTSNEVIAEGNFSSQPKIDSVSTPKIGAKRRKALSSYMCSEDRCEDNRRRNSREILPEITRRKSGGFLTQEQLISQSSNNRTILLSHSKSAEGSDLILHPKIHKSLETTQYSEVFYSPVVRSENLIVTNVGIQEEGDKIAMRGAPFGNFFKGDLNIWKYLFLLTLFMILAHYCFLTTYSCRL